MRYDNKDHLHRPPTCKDSGVLDRWDWNPNSGDTGGVVANDWLTVKFEKTDFMRTIGLTPLYAMLDSGNQ